MLLIVLLPVWIPKGKLTVNTMMKLIELIYRHDLRHDQRSVHDLRKLFYTVDTVAFDTVRYLCNYRGLSQSLIDRYITSRSQRVGIATAVSSYRSVSFGMPQGSILGPLLFLFYINALPNVTNIL